MTSDASSLFARATQEEASGHTLTDDQIPAILEVMDASLVVPKEKAQPQRLLCPVGLVGAGKTTVVEPLSLKLGFIRISTDEIRKYLKSQGYNYLRTKEIAAALIKKYIQLGHSVAIDADCAGSTKEIIEYLTKQTGITPIWIHIHPPEAFILNKLRTYNHTWLFKDADQAIENYERRKPLHEHLDQPFVYTFDPSRPDLDRQIDEAIQRIRSLEREGIKLA